MSDANLALADRFFAAIEAGDIDTVSALYADDVVVWHNHDGVEQDRAANLRTLQWVVANIGRFRYEEVRRSATADGFVQQHVARGINRIGEHVEMPACIVVRVAGGRIVRLDEYLDAHQANQFSR